MHVFPDGFRDFILRYWKEDVVAQLETGLQSEPPASIRLNPARAVPSHNDPDDETLAATIEGFDGRVPWCREGVYLKTRPTFTADPLFHAGAYYVQEASSMFLGHALRHILSSHLMPDEGGLCLDLCAAPGGKSTLLRSLLPPSYTLISNDPVRNRAQVLAENLAKWGSQNAFVTSLMPADIIGKLSEGSLLPADKSAPDTLSHGIDLLVCDVPCSGEGMFRKEPEAVRQWSPTLVEDCARLQRDIVRTAWEALRPGGILAYSTCTFNPLEDEANVLWICRELGGETIDIPCDTQWGILSFTDLFHDASAFAEEPASSELSNLNHCYHFLPGHVRGEGFFCSFIRKSPEAGEPPFATRRKKRNRPNPTEVCLPTGQLDVGDAPRVELNITDALRYLQRESLVLPPSTPKGIVTVCYCGQRLGLMNNLGSRANNLYPKEWRVRSGHLQPHSIMLLHRQ